MSSKCKLTFIKRYGWPLQINLFEILCVSHVCECHQTEQLGFLYCKGSANISRPYSAQEQTLKRAQIQINVG